MSESPKRPRAVHGIDFVSICISTYPEDLAKLDAKVAELRRLGNRRANRSLLIRAAIEQVDLSKVK
jgi:hypothetical protein